MSDAGSGPMSASLRIVRGDPSPEDIAALTALLTAAGGAPAAAQPPARGRWSDPALLHRRQLLAGPGAWRASLR